MIREHIILERLATLKAMTADPSRNAYEGRGLWDSSVVSQNWSDCQRALSDIAEEIDALMWDVVNP